MFYRVMFFFLALVYLFSLHAFQIDNISGDSCNSWVKKHTHPRAKQFFSYNKQVDTNDVRVVTNPRDLLYAAQDMLRYMELRKGKHVLALNPDVFIQHAPVEKVKDTLKFIIHIIKQDQKLGRYRIVDPDFLAQNFKFISWRADTATARNRRIKIPSDGCIRLTNYVIFRIFGSPVKTKKFSCALYNLRDKSVRTRYTKQDIVRGAFEVGANRSKVRPLVWVTREGLEDALMQGTVIVRLKQRGVIVDKFFTVHTHNGHTYDAKNKDVKSQKRYWFFREIKRSPQEIRRIVYRLLHRRDVIFAGDIYNLGLGKFIVLTQTNPVTKQREIRLGILADTGGAFVNNLYQLDRFAGIFAHRAEFYKSLRDISMTARAYLVYRD